VRGAAPEPAVARFELNPRKLGLFIVPHLVEAHAGRIWVDDAHAGGATFELALPAAGSRAELAPEE